MKWSHDFTLSTEVGLETLDAKYSEVEPWFHSWYRGKVEMLNANMATLTKTSTQGNETLYQMYAIYIPLSAI